MAVFFLDYRFVFVDKTPAHVLKASPQTLFNVSAIMCGVESTMDTMSWLKFQNFSRHTLENCYL